jgi:hypothetical protein
MIAAVCRTEHRRGLIPSAVGPIMKHSSCSFAACVAVVLGCSTHAHAQRPAFSATAAATDDAVTFAMLEARFAVSDAWSLAIAGAYLDTDSAADESQLRLNAVGSMRIGEWTLENRHLFSFSSASSERYRMRVRAVRPGLFGCPALSARAFNEVFIDLDRRRLFRNNVAIGVGLQGTATMSGELYYVSEMNRSNADGDYVLALLTYRFGPRSRE